MTQPPSEPSLAATIVAGDAFVLSGSDGDLRPGGDDGFFVRDTRFLDQLELTVDGAAPRPLGSTPSRPGSAVFHAWVPRSNDRSVDPTLTLTRRRIVDEPLREEILLDNRGRTETALTVEIACGTDFAYIVDVKHARAVARAEAAVEGERLVFRRPDGTETTEIRAAPTPQLDGNTLRWDVRLDPQQSARILLEIAATDPSALTPDRPLSSRWTREETLQRPEVSCSDPRVERLVRQSFDDLASLTLRDPEAPDDAFFAAGAPWYLTLFGRDSIWAAFMALPFGLAPARGALRALARRQGRRVDLATEEGPGKIPHEVRWGSLAERGDLPPIYYGTIDATPLFVTLVHEAWRWGLPDAELGELLPAVEAALAWMRDHGCAGTDGFLSYERHGERGLDNQGWKDSRDGIVFADGRLADPPIVLCEAQGYAYDAATRGAELLDHFARPGGDDWRTWAANLQDRFHGRFWVDDDAGPYVAIALDRDGRPVDGIASNMGHLLMTGILDESQTGAVTGRLADPSMSSGWGLRTLAATSGGYNPLSYHAGSVWPHDTAIVAWGCARSRKDDAASQLLRGLLEAAPHFDYRLPELFSGTGRDEVAAPLPYPASCSPQAWSAGASLLLLRAVLGLEADIPGGRLHLAPLANPPFQSLEVRGIRVGGGVLDVALREGGELDVDLRAEGLELAIAPGAP